MESLGQVIKCIEFSRYDKALLADSYNAGYQYTLKTLGKLAQETKERAAQH